MTISVGDLFKEAGLRPAGVVKWGDQIPLDKPGVYVVASSPDPGDPTGLMGTYRHDPRALDALKKVCPSVTIDGRSASSDDLAERLAAFWIPDSAILYIGVAGTSVRKRVNQYYVTRIGQRSPHAGGWWLKTLSALESLYVHYTPASDSRSVEAALIAAFARSVPVASARTLFDPERVAPFANVEIRPGLRKRHGLANYKLS